jgi:uncharacterized protein (DUF4415 family)
MKMVHGFPKMTEAMKAELDALALLPDDQIDTSDIPEWSAQDFAEAVPFHSIYKPRKQQITARLDSDVLSWLKAHGKGYQTLMNSLLRKEMLAELRQRRG